MVDANPAQQTLAVDLEQERVEAGFGVAGLAGDHEAGPIVHLHDALAGVPVAAVAVDGADVVEALPEPVSPVVGARDVHQAVREAATGPYGDRATALTPCHRRDPAVRPVHLTHRAVDGFER